VIFLKTYAKVFLKIPDSFETKFSQIIKNKTSLKWLKQDIKTQFFGFMTALKIIQKIKPLLSLKFST